MRMAYGTLRLRRPPPSVYLDPNPELPHSIAVQRSLGVPSFRRWDPLSARICDRYPEPDSVAAARDFEAPQSARRIGVGSGIAPADFGVAAARRRLPAPGAEPGVAARRPPLDAGGCLPLHR